MKKYMTEGNDFVKLINNHVLIKVSNENPDVRSWVVHIPTMNEYLIVDEDFDGLWTIRKQILVGDRSDTGSVLFKDLDWVYPNYLENYKQDDYIFSSLEDVKNIINKYLYEVL